MIFSAKNEMGIPTWLLAIEGKKTVTRRKSPRVVGSDFSIQPKRTKKGIARARVISCVPDHAWRKANESDIIEIGKEALREGFYNYNTLRRKLDEMYPKGTPKLWRIEFQVVKIDRAEVAKTIREDAQKVILKAIEHSAS